jgi:membrane protein YdbS with pleckstrin-like domain
MSIGIQEQIIALWAVFLFGMVFHSQLAMMPILYGENVAMPGYKEKMPVSHLWLMLGFYVIPMLAIAATVINTSPLYRLIHLGLTAIYTLMNFLHAAADLAVKPIEWHQIALMVVVFINGIVLNIVAFQWIYIP